MAKLLRLDVAQLTDVGRKREHNEDNMAYVIPKDPTVMAHKGALFIVADGMGGHAAGEVASEIAVDTVSNAYYQDETDDVSISLLNAIRRANAAIHQRAAENMLRSGMGTTCVAAVLRGNMAYIANVGDSRAYLVHQSRIRQISQDHSWVAEQVRAGLLTEEQARTHAQRNVITRSLGTQLEVDIDLFRETLDEGDTLLLCSDGLSGLVNDEDMSRTVDQFVPQESVYHLIERANENGGPDNITAVVARVQEVGVEPPNVRQPVMAGGPELSDEDTARLAVLTARGANMVVRNGEMPVPGSPLPYPKDPLVSYESDTAPQPASRVKKQHSRLFYPTLVLLLLFVLVAAGSGGYYFLHQRQVITSTLDNADQLISQANGELAKSPAQALQNLSQAQQQLQKLHNLDASANTRLVELQTRLVTETKTAIMNYDQGAQVVSLPCTNVAPNTLNVGAVGTQAQTVTVLQNSNSDVVLSYALGQDGKIYQLMSGNNQYALNNVSPTQNMQITNIVGAGNKIFALSTQTNTNAPASYALNLLHPGTGAQVPLQAVTMPLDPTLTQDGKTPILLTAWDNNAYVVLMSKANPNSAVLLSYSLDSKGNLVAPKSTPISVSDEIVSATAFPNQLFLLLADGSVYSSLINPDQSLAKPIPVLISAPIAPALATTAKDFTANTPVPTVAQTTQTGRGPLIIHMPSAANPATLSAGNVNADRTAHLFIGDPANHRVLDLVIQTAASTGGPGTTPTTTPGGSLDNSITLNLVQQYVSPGYFSVIKSAVTNFKGETVYILGQNAQNVQSLMEISAGPQQACAS